MCRPFLCNEIDRCRNNISYTKRKRIQIRISKIFVTHVFKVHARSILNSPN